MSRYKVNIQPFLFWLGAFLLLWGIISWFVSVEPGARHYLDTGGSVFYLCMGVLLMWSGFAWVEGIDHTWSTVVGVFFLVLAGVGFAVSGREVPNLWVLHFGVVYSWAHLVLGVVFLLGGLRVLTEDPFLPPRRYRDV